MSVANSWCPIGRVYGNPISFVRQWPCIDEGRAGYTTPSALIHRLHDGPRVEPRNEGLPWESLQLRIAR